MLKIDIISGFLGSGKTTFIKRLLETEIKNEKVVLIENEFGEISVDSMFLAESKIDIAELSQGCICCSLVGDFAKSLKDVIAQYNPDRIIIEPSGVGKLSDIIKAVKDSGLSEFLNTYVCLVDSCKAKLYAKNFKEFFADQISNANTIVLSRTDINSENKICESLDVVRKINEHANVVITPIVELSDKELLGVYENEHSSMLEELLAEEDHHICKCGGHHHHHDEECACHEHHHHDEECACHEHHHHDEECACHEHHHHEHHHEHHHHAEDVFTSVAIEAYKVYCFDKLSEVLHELAYTDNHGYIIRAKGIVKTTMGWKKFNITPQELVIEDNEALSIGSICVIGVNIEGESIKKLF